MAENLGDYFREKCGRVDKGLRSALRLLDCPPALRKAIKYTLAAPGKRIRPVLVMLAAEACGGSEQEALPAACAVEMVHTYSLIHDDLPAMDDDDLRRGQPSCHKEFGVALAILAGDALLTLAFQLLADGYPPATAASCCGELARAAGAAGMVGGQVADLEWEGRLGTSTRGAPTLADLEAVHARKTGALFRASVRLGAYAAQGEQPQGPSKVLLDALDGYGRCLGQLFQITDDLLDVEGEVEQTGKRVRKDAAKGKITYPAVLGLERSRTRAEELCREAEQHLTPLGGAAARLIAVVRYVLQRDR
jgi:geranylgeranyl diphosphate synthase type II